MFDENSIIFLDGDFVPLWEANISPLTHSLHYGVAVFEGIRAYKVNEQVGILELEKHIDRLFYSAEKIGAKIPFSKDKLIFACEEVLKKNNLTSAYIRPLVFFDDTSLGIKANKNKVRVLIAAWFWEKYLPDYVRVKVSSIRRLSQDSTVIDAKVSGHYVNSFLLTRDAALSGFDEALSLDKDGFVAEGSAENIFFIKDKNLYTPEKGAILPGITRQMVMDYSSSVLGYKIEERKIKPEELKDFSAAFFVGTAAEITPISEIVLEGGEKIPYNIQECVKIQEHFTRITNGIAEDSEKYFHFLD